MKGNFEKALRMIRDCEIKTEEEYNKLHKDFLLISLESLKYISGENDFEKIKKKAEEI